MITSVEIKNLRGIREGQLEGLTPLTILVGPNGSGKSTVLEGIWLATTQHPADALASLCKSRGDLPDAPRWLFHHHATPPKATTIVRTNDGQEADPVFTWLDEGEAGAVRYQRSQRDHGDFTAQFDKSGSLIVSGSAHISRHGIPETRLLGLRRFMDKDELPDLYSRAVSKTGLAALDVLQPLVKGLRDVRILTHSMTPVLHFVYSDHSVPVALAGDGLHELAYLVYSLNATADGAVLFEEPEAHKHPGAIRQTAPAVWTTVRRGIQVILTTHSLELIDALVDFATEEDLEKLSLFQTRLEDGQLISSRLTGRDVAFSRRTIEDDLR